MKKNKPKRCLRIGLLDTAGFEIDNRVYSKCGCCTTLRANNPLAMMVRRYGKKTKDNS